jgi:hypothetical protein
MRKSSIKLEIQKKFTDNMQNPRVPLLHDFDAYASHLPVRKFDGTNVKEQHFRLYEADYLARPADLQHMTYAIEETTKARAAVRYVSAPTASGKTASVLPAFLGSETATHYLYIPFSNNGNYHFKADPGTIETTDPCLAELQGEAFMVQCVKNLLEGKRGDRIPILNKEDIYQGGTSTQVGRYEKELEAYLIEKLGADAHIWFHVDEHRKMIDREYESEQKTKAAAAFSRGAMQVLTFSKANRVIATYTEPPTEIPSAASSAVCRVPVALPRLDIDQVLQYVPQLQIDNKKFTTSKEERLWSTLRVRLAMKIEELGLLFVLHRRSDDKKIKAFLTEFQKTVQNDNDSWRSKLIKLNNLCIMPDEPWADPNIKSEEAAKLLLGVIESNEGSDWLFKNRIKSGIIVTEPGPLVTCSLQMLLTLFDPNINPFNTGRDLFAYALNDDDPDLLSGTPLEYAYFWALACQSAVRGSIRFGRGPEQSFAIQCKELVPGRLFEETSNKLHKNSLKHVRKSVIYYAGEPRDHDRVTSVANTTTSKTFHPEADLFFVTDSNQLVLIDITGGIKDTVKKKLCKKTKWLQANGRKKISLQNGECINEIRCIILAPNVDSKFERTKGVDVVCGNNARRALGGLAQILPWLEAS